MNILASEQESHTVVRHTLQDWDILIPMTLQQCPQTWIIAQ
jgi:hypothetical protein